MDATKTKKVTDFLATVGGGAGAGFVDAKFPDVKVLGLSAGTVAGIAMAGVGLAMPRQAGKLAGPLLAAGEGALAYEAGRMTAERTTASVSGVGFLRRNNRLPANARFAQLGMRRAISQAELNAQLAAMRARQGRF